MEFDKSRVYTALNADEVKPGSKVFVADDLYTLRQIVEDNTEEYSETLNAVNPDDCTYRFDTDASSNYALCYLVSEPVPKGLYWTKLRIGDTIQRASTGQIAIVTAIDSFDVTNKHIFAGRWLSDNTLNDWEKVEEE